MGSVVGGIVNEISHVVQDVGKTAGGIAGDIGGLLNSPLGSLLGGLATSAFPPLGVALSAANLLGGGVGEAVKGAVSQVTQNLGLPKFLSETVNDMVDAAVGQHTSPSNPEIDDAVKHDVGHDMSEIFQKMQKSIADQMQEEVSSGEGGGGGSAKNFFAALAKALGGKAGEIAGNIVDLTHKLEGIDSSSAEGAKEFTIAQSELQGQSQEFGMLMSAISNILKSIGQAAQSMVGKN